MGILRRAASAKCGGHLQSFDQQALSCSLRLAAALLITASVAAAQNAPDFQSNTRLVETDVVVTSHGHPVAGLTKDDFTISDNGKPQTISTFRVIGPENRVRPRAFPPGVYSNRLAGSEEESGVTVLLMDRLNTDAGDQAEVRRQMLHYLESAPRDERIAIYSLNKTLRVIQDFTADQERIRRKLFSNGSAETSVDLTADLLVDDLPVTGDAMTDAMIQNSANEMKDFAIQNRVNVTAFALETIAKHLAGLRGRKKLVWFTSAFPAAYSYEGHRNGRTQIEIHQFGDDIEKAAKRLNDADVAVYPVDPRGILQGFDVPGIDTMNLFAGKTGGKAFYAINDIEGAVAAIEDDGEITYVIGYYPPDEKRSPQAEGPLWAVKKMDGSYHSVSVKVPGHSYEIRHRKGYFASETKPITEKRRRMTIEDAFFNPLESTGLGVVARAIPAEKPGIYNLDLNLDLHEFHLDRVGEGDKERWVALLAIATEFSAKKKPNGTLEEIKLTLTNARLTEALRTGYRIRRPYAAGELNGDLRLVVQDRASGDVGSVTLPIGAAKAR
ncbi:MAG TPA: VWA domain-containing protein [Bryobacteraceae bacterium]|nr:VWA domain-containing protein [Bryobacteraceae bacterium]